MSDILIYIGDFMGKPRMVRSDRYKGRPVVMRYWACKDQIVLAAKKQGFQLGNSFDVILTNPPFTNWAKRISWKELQDYYQSNGK